MRKLTQILLFNLFLNASAVVIDASGLAEDVGVNPQTGAAASLTSAAEAGQRISSSASVVESLLNLITAAIDTFSAMAQGSYAAPQMFANLGFPLWANAFIFAPLYLFGTIGMISMVAGRNA